MPALLASGDLGPASHFAQLAALAGETDPLVTLADYLADQNSKTVDKAEAFLLYSRAAEIGADEALLPLALYFEEGQFTDRDLGEAFRLIELAREKGIPEASYHAARFYESGAHADQDYKLARDLYLQAADAGMSEAYVRLGIIEREGCLGDADLQKAEEYFARAMEWGEAKAARMLSRLYSNSDYEHSDNLKSIEMWYRSAIMGDQGVRRSIADDIWKNRFGRVQIDGEVLLNLMVPGAAEGNLEAIGMFEDISTELNLNSVFQEVANELRHDLLEEGRFELAPELAEYELTSDFLEPAESHALALSYLEFAQDTDGRSRLVLIDYDNGKGTLIDLIREYKSLSYEEIARRAVRSTAIDGFSRPPMVLESPSPVYPSGLLDLGIEGGVTVGFVVDTQGAVQDIKIGEIEHEAFRKPIKDALKSWKFEPGLDDDVLPRSTRVQVRMKFHSDGGD